MLKVVEEFKIKICIKNSQSKVSNRQILVLMSFFILKQTFKTVYKY